MVLSYFIINIHMQLRRGEAGYNTSNFLEPIGIHAERKEEGTQVAAEELGTFGFSLFLLYTRTIH